MTEDEFFKRLAELSPVGWYFRRDGAIRTENDCECPVVAVANRTLPPDERLISAECQRAARHIGLLRDDARRIVDAADDPNSRDEDVRRTRERLMKTLGLDPSTKAT